VEQLKNAKIPTAVIDAVCVLTKNRNEDYFSYLEKVKHNPIARKVKLADLQHNSDLTRLNHLEKKDMDRLIKYKKAQEFLIKFKQKPLRTFKIHSKRFYIFLTFYPSQFLKPFTRSIFPSLFLTIIKQFVRLFLFGLLT